MTNENGDKEYERFIAHRETLLSIQRQNLLSYDKAIITLSSGALGLSMIFVDKIAGNGIVVQKGFLVSAWIAYLISILCNLASYRLGFREALKQMIDLDNQLRKTQEYPKGQSQSKSVTDILNEISFWLFAVGTILLCVFAYLNIGK